MTDRRDDLSDSQPPPLSEGHGEAETIDLSAPPGGLKMSIGPYRLVKQIGEGGMGVIYEAEQEEPIRRTVALKIVKPGMDSERVMARFEAERNALALMDHPHIAQVLGCRCRGRRSALLRHGAGAGAADHGVTAIKQRMGVRERVAYW